jgi:uncharacterized protein YqfA (UPF0365 family)
MPYLIVLIVVGLFVLGFLFLFFRFFGLWFRALLSGAYVGLGKLIGMWLRHVNAGIIVDSRIMLTKAGIEVDSDMLETHFLARGDVIKVSRALVAANKANIPLPFQRAAAIDLAGRDVLEAVRTSVNPKVIDCPDVGKGKHTIDAVAKDGIQLQVKARVTVRANLERLVGGATEETIIARVGEGIVTTIGSSESYKSVLENPDTISKRVLEKGLDAGTAFEILSIDIADIDVGENVGAKLQADQAEADKRRFQGRRKSAAPRPRPGNRRLSPWSRRTAPRWSWRKRRYPWLSPKLSSRGIWGSWIITGLKMSRPTRICAPP